MTQQEEVRKKARRDFLLILLVLPFGILCMFFVGGAAIKLVPFWSLETNMGSKINPRVDFVFKGTPYVMEQVSADILTPVAWKNLFLTPNAFVPPVVSQPPVAFVPPVNNPPATEPPPVDVPATVAPPTEPPPSGGGPPPPPPPIVPPPSGGGPPPSTVNADLDITKTSTNTTYTAGGIVTYSITVINNGSGTVTATLSDAIPAQVDQWVWCEGSPCTPTMTPTDLDLSTSITLASGESVAYTVTANIKSPLTAVNLANTAKVTMPANFVDPDTGNNTDTGSVTIPPNINLSISKTSSTSTYSASGVVPYQVVVTNNSTFNLTGVKVSDKIPDVIAGWLWVCTATNATCSGIIPSVQFTSDFSDTVSINAGGNISYSVSALIVNPSGAILIGDLVNTATVSEPITGYSDSDSVTHTSATVSNVQVGTNDSPGDNVPYPVTEGTSLTLYLSQPIVTGHAGPDFVFYEYLNTSFPPSRVYLDHVIVSISQTGLAGSWVPVFNWGDNNPDTNTNANIADGADIQTACPTEADNCEILPAFLYPYPGWGITIDIDSIVSAGSYPWIRFEAPSGSGDAAQVDAIQILP